MKNIITIFLFFAVVFTTQAQQDPLVSMYMFNGLLINPAYAGTKPYVRSTLLHRSQWVGWKGAPKTQIFTIDGRLRDKVSAAGLVVSNDNIGATNRVDVYGSYAYHLNFKKGPTLSLGIKGGMSWFSANTSGLTYWDTNDDVYNKGVRNNFMPNVGIGAFYYTKKFYAGISVPQVISYDPLEMFSIGKENTVIPKVRRHYFLTTGYAFVLSKSIVIKPSVLLRFVNSAPAEADFNVHVLLNQLLWLGVSYRTQDAMVGMIQLQILPALRFGYAYDYTLTSIGNYSSGSHEIMMGLDLGHDVIKMKTPRYF